MRALTLTGLVLASALAFGQANQPNPAQPNNTQANNPQSDSSQPNSAQPAGQQPTPPTAAKPRPATPHPIVDAARASKQAKESATPAKVYRNKDVKDPADAGSPAAAQPATLPTAKTADDDQIRKDRAFEAQAKVFKSQILVVKGKIVDIQNRITDLK